MKLIYNTMRYLKFENINDAEQRSKQLWEQKLGRPKNEDDKTEFMYSWEISEGDDGGSYLLVNDEGEFLSDQEKVSLEEQPSYEEWRQQYQPESYQSEKEELESM